ncbi:MAG: DUF1559 domain-containing protein, partial [Planctomycetota bacterium]
LPLALAKRGWYFGLLSCLVVAGTSLGTVAQERSFTDRVAPDECLMFASWSGSNGKVEDPNNHAELLMAEPEMQEFFGAIARQASNLAGMAMRNEPAMKQKAAQLVAPEVLTMLFAKPGALFIDSFEMGPQGPLLSAGVVFDTGDNASQLMGAFATLIQSEGIALKSGKLDGEQAYALAVPDAPMPLTVFFAAANGKLVIGLGKDTTERLVKIAKGEGAAADPAWLADVKAQLPLKRRTSVGYLDIESTYKIALGFAGEDGQQVQAMADSLGLGNLKNLVSSAGYENEGIVDHTRLNWNGEPSGILAMIGSQPLNLKSLSYLPDDTLFATSLSLDLADAMDQMTALMGEVAPNELDELNYTLEQIEDETGINVRSDLLEPLGATWTIFNGAGDGLGSGVVLTVDVDDEEAVEQLIGEMIDTFGQIADPSAPKIVKREFGEATVYTGQVYGLPMPFQPSWALHEGHLFVSLYPQILRPYLEPSELDKKLELSDMAKQENVVAYSYIDSRRQYELLYTYAAVLGSMGGSFAQEFGMGPDAEILAQAANEVSLPSLRSMYRHVIPTESVLKADENGWQATNYQTVPSVNMAVVAPVGIGLLLPAVQSARVAARRMQSSNNLKQIALAFHNYESAYRRFPAAYSTNKEGEPLLSWRVHILPFIEQQALYEQFKLDEPWDSEHNLALLEFMPEVYRSPESFAEPTMTNYLGITGEKGVVMVDPDAPAGTPAGCRFRDIIDGTSNTVMVIEASDALSVEWTKPADFDPGEEDFDMLFGMLEGGTNAAFADGSVQFLSEYMDFEVLKAMFTRDGGEVVNF